MSYWKGRRTAHAILTSNKSSSPQRRLCSGAHLTTALHPRGLTESPWSPGWTPWLLTSGLVPAVSDLWEANRCMGVQPSQKLQPPNNFLRSPGQGQASRLPPKALSNTQALPSLTGWLTHLTSVPSSALQDEISRKQWRTYQSLALPLSHSLWAFLI